MLQIGMVGFFKLAESISELDHVFRFIEHATDDADRVLTEEESTNLARTLTTLLSVAQTLDMPVSVKFVASRVGDRMPRSRDALRAVRDVVHAELETKKFFFVEDRLAKHYDNDAVLSDEAKLAFPSCYAELKYSGNCLACGEWTASAFHSMRAAEIGVRLFGRSLGVSFPDKPIEMAEWYQVLTNADAKIKEIGQRPKSAERETDQRFYSEAAAQFRYFKDAWRVRVAHARAVLSENEALRVHDHVRDFFEALSSRLSETDDG